MEGWRYRIYLGDIFGDPTMEFPARRDEITRRLKRSFFVIEAVANGDAEISNVLQGLREAETAEEYDRLWQWFYGWADRNRVKVETDPVEE